LVGWRQSRKRRRTSLRWTYWHKFTIHLGEGY